MEDSRSRSLPWLDALAGVAGLAACLWLGYQAFVLQLPGQASRQELAAPPALQPCRMTPDGYLRGRLHGSADLEIDWRGASLACAGNTRPGEAGLRLFFAGQPAAGDDRLMLVIGLDAGIAGLAGQELPASVTLIDEASSQFFHTSGGRCFTRITTVDPQPDAAYTYRIAGSLYCAGAIAAVTGSGTVTLGDIAYAGRLTLDRP